MSKRSGFDENLMKQVFHSGLLDVRLVILGLHFRDDRAML